MNLLQVLLNHIKEPLPDNAKWVAHNHPSNELLVFDDEKPNDNGSREMYCSSRGAIKSLGITASFSSDWDKPLEITPTVRKLVDIVLGEDAGWYVYHGQPITSGYYDIFAGNEIVYDVDRSIVYDFETILYRTHKPEKIYEGSVRNTVSYSSIITAKQIQEEVAILASLDEQHKQSTSSPEEERAFKAVEKALKANEESLSKSDGSTASYYELPANPTELQHLISHRNMNSQIGEVFRACYRYGLVSHSDMLRDAKKIRFYAQAEVERLEKLG